MSSPSYKANTSYTQLISLIKIEAQEGLANAEKLVTQQRVLTYWNIGKYIHQYFRDNPMHRYDRAEQTRLIASEINFQTELVLRMIKFYECYPRISKKPALNWGQYRALLNAPEDKRRDFERQAVKENLGSEKILAAIKQFKQAQKVEGDELRVDQFKKLILKRGKLNVYKIIQSKYLPLKQDEILVNCGFDFRRQISVKNKTLFRGGTFVKSEKTGEDYHLKIVERKEEHLYTFRAYVERVIDGDTLIAHIDCGFYNWVCPRLRLRGINAPDVNTVRGLEAKRFVEERLPQGSLIVIKTYQVGKFGRKIADVFYFPHEKNPHAVAAKGIFLNQELLDADQVDLYS